MKRLVSLKIIRLFICIILTVVFSDINTNAADPKRVALVPFKINSDKDLTFLKNGIFDMLTSRLSKEGQVEVLSREEIEKAVRAEAASGSINEPTASRIGRRLNADFVLFGSLTVLGENVSIDAKMVDVSGSKPTMTFFDQSQDLGAVITKINLIAADINSKIFERPQTAQTPAPSAPAAAAPVAKTQPPKRSNIHAHPEKVLEEDGFIMHDETENIGSPGIQRGPSQQVQERFWRSASFKYLIHGIALGDVDGDGRTETVLINQQQLHIFRSTGRTLQKIAEHDEGMGIAQLAVDVADINDNGFAEIFITGLSSSRNSVSSYVIEYNGQRFVKIFDELRYYYRVAETPNRGKILLGQRPRSGRHSAGAIYEMGWQNNEYVPTDPIRAPRDTNLIGLTMGDVLNNGGETAVAYKDGDHIQIIDSSGDVIWDDNKQIGGSMMYYSVPWDDRGLVIRKWYYPLRLVVWHNREKEESEVIAVQNRNLSGDVLEDFRYYTNTYITGLTWDGMGLGPSWKTRELKGYIQDFSVGDFDNDGQDELIAALVVKEGRVAMLTDAKTSIIGYELTSPAE